MKIYDVTQTYWFLEDKETEHFYATTTVAAKTPQEAQEKACLMGMFDNSYESDINNIGIGDTYEVKELATLTENEFQEIEKQEKKYQCLLELYRLGCDKKEDIPYPKVNQYEGNSNISIERRHGTDTEYYMVTHNFYPNLQLEFDNTGELDQIWLDGDWAGNYLSDIKDLLDETFEDYIYLLEDIMEEKEIDVER